jgi:endonuclease/exonuclease/phosphatase family metal-dependent hydrolase
VKRPLFKILIGGLGIAIMIPVIFIGYVSWKNPTHQDIEEIGIDNNQTGELLLNEEYSVLIFNIGYGGLDKDQDFFMDGGASSRAESKAKVLENVEGMLDFLSRENPDFMLLQEVDIRSARSYDVNQYEMLQTRFQHYASAFSYNYQAIWVPVPIVNPMGYARSGLATLSKHSMHSGLRRELTGQESWPVILADLDRSLLETRISVANGRELILVNLHLSAYDEGGILREQQVSHLVSLIEEVYRQNDYVILGGDWNQLLGTSQLEDDDFMEEWPEWLVPIADSLENTGYQWGVDESVMTVRDIEAPYKPGKTFETVIDGFLVSPNIKIIEVIGHDLGFEYSDHNPVTLRFQLIED